MKIKHLFLALVVFSLAFVSCKKDENKPQGDNRTPIAMRNASGQIVNMKSVEDVQQFINQNANAKDAERFVLESYSITEPTSQDPWCIKFVMIDVEENCSYSMALIGNYVEEINRYIYRTKDVESGNFSFNANRGQKVVKFENHQLSIVDDPTPEMMPPGWFVQCQRGENCKIETGSCSPTYVGPGDYTCSECNKNNANEPAQCHLENVEYSGFWGMIMNILRAF